MDETETIEVPTTLPDAPPVARRSILAIPQAIWRNMFGLDFRSLALLRIGLGLCLFWVAYTNALEMRAFYTDDGVLPRSALIVGAGSPVGISLYFANGGEAWVALLFALQIIAALMMVVGYRTTLAAVLSYILLISMQNRHPVLLYGADIALRVGLFWTMFLPTARRFSIDRTLGRVKPPPTESYVGIPGIALLAQIAMIYTGGALMKTGPSWQVDHTAVANALSLDVYSRPIGHWLLQFDGLTRALTVFTLYVETYGPILFVLPVLHRWGRLLGFLLFAGLQVGFNVCMVMGIFGPIMIALVFVLLPDITWTRFLEPLGRWFTRRIQIDVSNIAPGLRARWQTWRDRQREGNALRALVPSPRIAFVAQVLVGVRAVVILFLAGSMILWNLGNVPGQPWRLAPKVDHLMYTIGLNQTFDMFAPDPQKDDGWFVVAGTMENGRTIDMMSGVSPASYEKPASVAGSYQTQLWLSYLITFWYPGSSSPKAFAEFLRRRWNESHSEDEQIGTIKITEMSESGGPPATKMVTQVPIFP